MTWPGLYFMWLSMRCKFLRHRSVKQVSTVAFAFAGNINRALTGLRSSVKFEHWKYLTNSFPDKLTNPALCCYHLLESCTDASFCYSFPCLCFYFQQLYNSFPDILPIQLFVDKTSKLMPVISEVNIITIFPFLCFPSSNWMQSRLPLSPSRRQLGSKRYWR